MITQIYNQKTPKKQANCTNAVIFTVLRIRILLWQETSWNNCIPLRAFNNHIVEQGYNWRSAHLVFAHFKSSVRGFMPVKVVTTNSAPRQNCIASSGLLSQPVVIQYAQACGAMWCSLWWCLGNITFQRCSVCTHGERPKYVWDHLCICKKEVPVLLFLRGK